MDDLNRVTGTGYKDDVDFKYTVRRILSEDLVKEKVKENMKRDADLETDDELYA